MIIEQRAADMQPSSPRPTKLARTNRPAFTEQTRAFRRYKIMKSSSRRYVTAFPAHIVMAIGDKELGAPVSRLIT